MHDAEDIFMLQQVRADGGSLKQRSFQDIVGWIEQYMLYKIDGILLGSYQLIPLEEGVLELGAFVTHPGVSKNHPDLHLSARMVQDAIDATRKQWKQLISVTNNTRLEKIYRELWATILDDSQAEAYASRIKKSPGKILYILNK